MNLNTPPEPKDVKEFIVRIRRNLGKNNDICYDASAVWAFNKIPRYLWEYWKNELKDRGITWQKFLRILKFHTNDFIMWALHDELAWEELISHIISTLKRYEKPKEKASRGIEKHERGGT